MTKNMIKFNNGQECPILGLGTCLVKESVGKEAVKNAIDLGYRMFDTAYFYGNEKEVGEAIREKIAEEAIRREDVFVTSKLWNTFHTKDLVGPAMEKTLGNLGLEYIDLFLMHYPFGFKEGWDLMPTDAEGNVVLSDVDYVETWKAMENCVRAGKTKSIGLSNFNKEQTLRILEVAEILPANTQVECHPYLNQSKLIEFCRSKGITVTAYRPLCPPTPWNPNTPLNDPLVEKIAEKRRKTIAQILIKFQIQRGVIAVPKTVTKQRLESNMDVFNFELTDEDMAELTSLDKGAVGRQARPTYAEGHKYYPFNAEY